MLTSSIIEEENQFIVEISKKIDDKEMVVKTFVAKETVATVLPNKIIVLDRKIAKSEKELAELQQLLAYQIAERDALKTIKYS